TAAPTEAAVPNTAKLCSFPTLIPIVAAASDPSVRVSRGRAREASMIHPIIMNGPASHTCVMDLSVSEPSIQNRISVAAKGLGDRLSTNVDAAPAKADTATPARMR